MTTHDTEDRAATELRAMLTHADPDAGSPASVPDHLLDRVLADVAADPVGPGVPAAGWPHPLAGAAPEADGPGPATGAVSPPASGRTRAPRPRWAPWLLAAASLASLALAAGTILPGLAAGGSDTAASQAADAPAADSAGSAVGGAAMPAAEGATAPGAMDGAAALAPDAAAAEARSGAAGEEGQDNTLVRSASMLVGTEDVTAARDAFVADVLANGGRVTSETVVTEDGNGGVMPYDTRTSSDMGMSYPYPWYPSGPGIWLTVQVPADDYERTVEAARELGEVVQLQQSSYDVGQQVTDVDARIAVLEASVERLEALLDEADDVTDLISIENAIAQRQAELDSLRAQQRDLANQTAMSAISLTLMTPDDAQQSIDPQPQQSWWASFLDGLGELWTWLGRALLIVSPLVLAMAIIWWVRRRRDRRSAGAGTGSAESRAAAGPPAPPATQAGATEQDGPPAS